MLPDPWGAFKKSIKESIDEKKRILIIGSVNADLAARELSKHGVNLRLNEELVRLEREGG